MGPDQSAAIFAIENAAPIESPHIAAVYWLPSRQYTPINCFMILINLKTKTKFGSPIEAALAAFRSGRILVIRIKTSRKIMLIFNI